MDALGVDLDDRGVVLRVVLADLLDGTTVALGARVHDDDTVVRGADLAETLQTNLGSHVCGISCSETPGMKPGKLRVSADCDVGTP